MQIVIINGGFVLACRTHETIIGPEGHPPIARLTNARTIIRWGTTKWLGELLHGPTKDTKLGDLIPIVDVPLHALGPYFEVTGKWDALL